MIKRLLCFHKYQFEGGISESLLDCNDNHSCVSLRYYICEKCGKIHTKTKINYEKKNHS